MKPYIIFGIPVILILIIIILVTFIGNRNARLTELVKEKSIFYKSLLFINARYTFRNIDYVVDKENYYIHESKGKFDRDTPIDFALW